MDCMLIASHLWTDVEFLKLSRVGRLAYLELSRLCDDNWGHCCYRNMSALVMALCPDETEAAAYGDTSAQATLAEVREQIELAMSLGLLIGDETVDGLALGYAGWEKYTGKARRRRGKPRFAMGPKIAASRHWGKHQLSDKTFQSASFHDYATRLGIFSITEASRSTSSREVVDKTAKVVERDAEVVEKESETWTQSGYPGIRVSGYPGEVLTTTTNVVERTNQNDWPPSTCSMPPDAVALVKRVGARHPRQIVTDHRLRPELPKRLADFHSVTDCETWEVWCVACALMAQAENRGEWIKKGFDAAIRDHACPGLAYRKAARKLLGLDAPDDSPDATTVLRPAMVCPACGWTDPPGGSERFCASCMSDLVPAETQEASQFAPGSPVLACEAPVVAEVGRSNETRLETRRDGDLL